MRRSGTWPLLLGLALAGCGGTGSTRPSTEDSKQATLSEVGELYRLYTIERKKPPAKVADLAPLAPVAPMGLRAIQEGTIVVRLGAKLPDTDEGTGGAGGDEVLAFEREVPESGGRALMLDRTVREMTPDEFRTAKLAGTSSSAAPSKQS